MPVELKDLKITDLVLDSADRIRRMTVQGEECVIADKVLLHDEGGNPVGVTSDLIACAEASTGLPSWMLRQIVDQLAEHRRRTREAQARLIAEYRRKYPEDAAPFVWDASRSDL